MTWTSVTLNIHLQKFLRLQILKNGSMRSLRNLHNIQISRNIFTLSDFTNTQQFLCYFPSNFNSINKFSTTDTLLKSKDKGKEKKKVVQVNLDEISQVTNVERMLSQFDNIIENFKDQMIKHVGLRTSIGAIEELVIEYEGEEYKLQELVEIIRKPKMVVMNISAFPQTIPKILDILAASQMNLNPQQEGTTLYIPVPKITKEHRENLAKKAKVFFVKCKDNITDVRNKYVKDVKKKEKERVPIDLIFRVESYISSLSQEYIGKAQTILETKQKELLREE